MGFFDGAEKKPQRFTEICAQSVGMVEARIVRDNETGVNYIFGVNMASGGVSVTALLDSSGNVYVDKSIPEGKNNE